MVVCGTGLMLFTVKTNVYRRQSIVSRSFNTVNFKFFSWIILPDNPISDRIIRRSGYPDTALINADHIRPETRQHPLCQFRQETSHEYSASPSRDVKNHQVCSAGSLLSTFAIVRVPGQQVRSNAAALLHRYFAEFYRRRNSN
jgi:hypothetical protein